MSHRLKNLICLIEFITFISFKVQKYLVKREEFQEKVISKVIIGGMKRQKGYRPKTNNLFTNNNLRFLVYYNQRRLFIKFSQEK